MKGKYDSHSYDIMYAAYLINEWTKKMIRLHVKHIQVTTDKTGTIITLEGLSGEKMLEFDMK